MGIVKGNLKVQLYSIRYLRTLMSRTTHSTSYTHIRTQLLNFKDKEGRLRPPKQVHQWSGAEQLHTPQLQCLSVFEFILSDVS